MRSLFLGLCWALAMGGAASAASDAELAAPIHKFVDAFNKGDLAAAADAYAPTDLTITDEVPPFTWRGPGALKAWAGDLVHDIQRHGLTNASLTVGEPVRAEVDGDSAYVIVPAVYAFQDHGASMYEAARMTFTLVKGAANWKITGWTFTGPKATPGPAPAPHGGP